MRRRFKFQWGPLVGALLGAGLMAALATGQESRPIHAGTDGQAAQHGAVSSTWNAVGQFVVESVHKLTFK